MGFNGMIRGSVKQAFKAAGDLAVMATFTHRSDAGFDFASNAPKTPTTASKPLKAIFVQKTKQGDGKIGNSIQTSFLLSSEDAPTAIMYDTLTVSAGMMPARGTWRIVPPVSDDGYLLTLNCVKEA